MWLDKIQEHIFYFICLRDEWALFAFSLTMTSALARATLDMLR